MERLHLQGHKTLLVFHNSAKMPGTSSWRLHFAEKRTRKRGRDTEKHTARDTVRRSNKHVSFESTVPQIEIPKAKQGMHRCGPRPNRNSTSLLEKPHEISVVGAMPSHHQHLQPHCHRLQWQASFVLRKRSLTQCPQSCFRQGAAYSQMLQSVPACREKYLVLNSGAVGPRMSALLPPRQSHCFTANMRCVWQGLEEVRLRQNIVGNSAIKPQSIN